MAEKGDFEKEMLRIPPHTNAVPDCMLIKRFCIEYDKCPSVHRDTVSTVVYALQHLDHGSALEAPS